MAREKSQDSKVSSEKQPADAEYPAREARERFERAVDVAVATKPKHKPAKAKRSEGVRHRS